MSLRGKLHRVLSLKGELTEQTPKLQGTLASKDRLQGALTPKGGFSGVLVRMGKRLGATARKLAVFYRFAAAHDRIIVEHEAKATTADAVETSVDTAVRTAVSAMAQAVPTQAASVDAMAHVCVYARLVSYNLAEAHFRKGIAIAHEAAVATAPAAVARYVKAVELSRVTKAVSAPAAIAESRFNVIPAAVTAAAVSAPAVISLPFAEEQRISVTAAASTAETVPAAVNLLLGVTHYAKATGWIDPVLEDGVLYIRQVAAPAVFSDGCLEVH